MATLRAKTLKYPGAHGINTIEATLGDENSRFGNPIYNGVVDSAGKLVSRKDFVKQTAGFSNTLKALYNHRGSNGTETIFSAAAGIVYSGISSLTSRFDYRAGSQIVDVGGAKAGASTTGLANDATTYGMTVAVDGAAAQQITVTGSAAQSYTTLLAEINTDLTGASCMLVGGNLKIISDTTGAASAISILNTAGSASVALLSTLSNFVSVRTAVAGTTSQENWQFASFKGKVFMAQAGQHFTALEEDTFGVVSVVGQPWISSPNVVIAAYGRLWVADDAAGNTRGTIWWSNLLDGLTWNSGDAGNISLSEAWPKGQDSVIALAAAFGRLIVLGRKAILLYTLPADNNPANMTLTDVVEDLGCVARDSVVVTDTGIYFLSDNGIYRIDKLGQTTSLMAAPQVSLLYNDLVQAATLAETAVSIRGGFYPTEGLYVLSFPATNKTFCVHTRKNVPIIERPIGTIWNNVGRPFYGFAFDKDGNWYSGGVNGVHKYTGYTPDGASNAYNLQWTGQWHPFEDESRLKHMKSASHVLEAAIGQTGTFEWRFDYLTGTTRSHAFTCSATEFAENPGIGNVSFGIGGSGKVVQPSLTFPINGSPVTLHQTRLYATPGKVVNG